MIRGRYERRRRGDHQRRPGRPVRAAARPPGRGQGPAQPSTAPLRRPTRNPPPPAAPPGDHVRGRRQGPDPGHHPGCGRPISPKATPSEHRSEERARSAASAEPSNVGVSGSSPDPVVPGRQDRPGQRRPVLLGAPPRHRTRRMGSLPPPRPDLAQTAHPNRPEPPAPDQSDPPATPTQTRLATRGHRRTSAVDPLQHSDVRCSTVSPDQPAKHVITASRLSGGRAAAPAE